MKEGTELYKRYRPRKLADVVGQPKAVMQLERMLKNGVPHTILFAGSRSGVGKTTLARILKDELKCNKLDFTEINAAEDRGIDMARDLSSRMEMSSIGPCKVWIIDEMHRVTSSGQSALLKTLEDTPSHVYFFLCTTEPDKLLPTIRTRCEQVNLVSIADEDLKDLVMEVAEKEKVELSVKVVSRLVDSAEGSARQLLVNMEKVVGLPTEQDQLDAILPTETKRAAFDIVRALLWYKSSLKDVAVILTDIQGQEEPEGLRRLILVNANKALLKAMSENDDKKAERANAVIQAFQFDFFAAGKAGLTSSCYAVLRK